MDPKQIIELGKLDIINPEDVGYLLLGSTKAKRTERTFNVEKYSDEDYKWKIKLKECLICLHVF